MQCPHIYLAYYISTLCSISLRLIKYPCNNVTLHLYMKIKDYFVPTVLQCLSISCSLITILKPPVSISSQWKFSRPYIEKPNVIIKCFELAEIEWILYEVVKLNSHSAYFIWCYNKKLKYRFLLQSASTVIIYYYFLFASFSLLCCKDLFNLRIY